MKLTQARMEWALAAMALVFLAAYSWPVLMPDLPTWARTMCSIALWITWLAFGADYVARLARAEKKGSWFIRHLLDLAILMLPILRPLRLLRLVTLVRVLNRSAVGSFRGRVGLYVATGSALLAFVAALAVLDAERGESGANIRSFGDAIWWACTTMTTVGYGDRFPVTDTGRLVGVGLMVAGIGLLGTVTATLASWIVDTATTQSAAAAVDAIETSELEQSRADADLRSEIAELRHQVERLVVQFESEAQPPRGPLT